MPVRALGGAMKISMIAAVAMAAGLTAAAQTPEKKPVPKDSVRVSISGCTKGYMFTVGPRMPDVAGSANVPPGTHLRMNGPKSLIAEIDAYKSSRVAITGIMKKGQFEPTGIGIGGIRLAPASPSNVGGAVGVVAQPPSIDVEGWSPATGECS